MGFGGWTTIAVVVAAGTATGAADGAAAAASSCVCWEAIEGEKKPSREDSLAKGTKTNCLMVARVDRPGEVNCQEEMQQGAEWRAYEREGCVSFFLETVGDWLARNVEP